MDAERPISSPSITESPWYWVYLFATAGLVALILAGPRFGARQSEIERSGQGRQRAIQSVSGREPATAMSTPDATRITLRPLYWVLAVLLLIAWANLVWRHQRLRRARRGRASSVSPV